MADKIVVLNGGRVEQIGAPLDLYDRPANQFVAGFLGSPAMNFLNGTITRDGFVAPGIMLPLPEGVRGLQDRNVVYGIRPEHFTVDDSGVTMEVLLVEPMGSETQVTMKLGEITITGVFRERITLTPGSTIRVRPELASIHLFAADSGQRLN